MKKPGFIRVIKKGIAVMLLTAVVMSDSSVTALAETADSVAAQNSEQNTGSTETDAGSVITPEEDSEQENGNENGTGNEDTAEESAEEKENDTDSDTEAVTKDIAEEAEDLTVQTEEADDNEEDIETVELGEFSGEQSYGKAMDGAAKANRFSNKSRTDYFRKYYNQLSDLNEYATKVYDYFNEEAEDLKNYDSSQTYKVYLYEDGYMKDFGSDSSLMSSAKAAYFYGMGAYMWDNPLNYWLEANYIKISVKANFGTDTDSNRYLKDMWLEFTPKDENTGSGAFLVDAYVTEDGSGQKITDTDQINDDKSKMDANISTIYNAVEDAISGQTDQDGDSDFDIRDQVIIISDYLTKYNYYNPWFNKVNNTEMAKAWVSAASLNWSDDKEWVTSDGKGSKEAPVCMAYSYGFKIICDKLGIPCIVVVGDGHMWNNVQTDDGNWYAVDVTWNDTCNAVNQDETTYGWNEYDEKYKVPQGSTLMTTEESTNYNAGHNLGLLNDNAHQYIMVGGNTKDYDGNGFTAGGHHSNSGYWANGYYLSFPSLSSDSYESDVEHTYGNRGPQISNLTAVQDGNEISVSYKTDKAGQYYAILRSASDTSGVSVYDVQNLKTNIDGGSASGSVAELTDEEAASGKTVEFTIGTGKLVPGSYYLYLIQLTSEEYISDMLISDKIEYATTLNSISIKDIPASDSHSAGVINTLKLGQGLTLKYTVDPSGYKIYTSGNESAADDDDLIIRLTSSDSGILAVNDQNNSVWAKKAGTAVITADAYIKSQKSEASYHKTASITITVKMPKNEIIDIDGDKFISFDGENRYSGWVSYKNGSYSQGQVSGADWYYFLDSGDYIDDDSAYGRTLVSDDRIGYMADGPVWIGGSALYKFASDGKFVKFWRRLKDISFVESTEEDPSVTPAAETAATISRGEKYTATIVYVSEDDGTVKSYNDQQVKSEDINDDKRITVTSSDPSKIEVSDVTYEYKTGSEGKSEYRAKVTLTAVSQTTTDITVTASSGDSDNKYAPSAVLTVIVELPEGWFVSGGNKYYGIENETTGKVELCKGWLKYSNGIYTHIDAAPADPDNDLADYYYFDGDGIMSTGIAEIDSKYYEFGTDGKLTGVIDMKNGGFITVNGDTYYYKNSSDRAQSEIITADGKSYYFDENYKLVKSSWITVAVEEGYEYKYYYANSSGILVKGMQTVNGNTYYFDDDCVMTTGIQTIDGKDYFFKCSPDTVENGLGSLCYGYFNERNSAWDGFVNYYSSPASAQDAGVLHTGLYTIDGTARYFGTPFSANKSDRYLRYAESSYDNGWLTSDDGTYYINSKGEYLKGWQNLERGGTTNRYYFYTTGNESTIGTMAKGLVSINGSVYFFSDASGDGAGIMAKGRALVEGSATADDTSDDKYMFFNANGVRITGWQRDFNADNTGTYNTWDYYDAGTFYACNADKCDTDPTESGTPQYDSNWYKLDTVSGSTLYYHFKNNMTKVTGWQTLDGHKFYFNTDRDAVLNGSMLTGFNKIGNNYYYFYEKGENRGSLLTGNGVVTIDDPASENEGDTISFCVNTSGVLQLGWQKIDGEWRYFDRNCGYEKDSSAFSFGTDGWVEADGHTYYFKNGTSMVTGFVTIDNKDYYFSENADDGTLGQLKKNEFFTINGKTYLATPDGSLASGYMSYDDNGASNNFLFDSKHVMLTGWQKVSAGGVQAWLYFASDAVYPGSEQTTDTTSCGNWFSVTYRNSKKYYYYFSNGTTMLKGWQTIGGRKYYFGSDGRLVTGDFSTGNKYYHALDDDTASTSAYDFELGSVIVNGFSSNGEKYYGSDGAMLTGWQTIADSTSGTKYTYFFEDNVSSEKYGEKYIGWKTVGTGSNIYVFDENGRRLTGYAELKENGPAGIDANMAGWYCIGSNGAALKGWQKVRINGSDEWKYFNRTTGKEETIQSTSGNFVTVVINAGSYESERTATFYIIDKKNVAVGFRTINGKKYYFETSASNSSHEYGQMYQQEWIMTGGKKYYAGSDGTLATSGEYEVDNNGKGYSYYFDNDGAVKTGWILTGTDGIEKSYYNDRISDIKDISYGRNENSEYLGNGWYRTGDIVDKDYHYYHFSNGNLQKGWQTIDGKKYCFGSDGAMLTGLFCYNGNWYCTDEDGIALSGFKTITTTAAQNGTSGGTTATYYFNANGQRLYGWQTIDGKQYYFDKTSKGTGGILTGAMLTGKVKIGNDYYIFNQDGSRQVSGFIEENGSTYYVDANGKALKGWQTIKTTDGSYKYYFDASGAMATGLWNIGGSLYYLQESRQVTGAGTYPMGAMRTGYLNIGDYSYDFSTQNGAALTGWQKVNENSVYKWRYFATANDVADPDRLAVLGREYTTSGIDSFDQNGYKFCEVSFPYGDPATYCLKAGGPLKGWQTIKNDGEDCRFYFDTVTGEMSIGSAKIGNSKYYFSPDTSNGYLKGEMIMGSWKILDYSGNSGYVYYKSNGVMASGWTDITTTKNVEGVNTKVTGRYYFDPSDYDFAAAGFFKVGNNTYYACENGSGAEISGNEYEYAEVVKGYAELTESVLGAGDERAGEYFFDNSGAMKTGWQNVSVYDGEASKNVTRSRYFDPSTGKWDKGTDLNGDGVSILTVGSNIYRLNSSSTLKHTSTGESGDLYKPSDASDRFIDGYYSDANGKLLTGWQKYTINGKSQTFYFDKTNGKMLKGINLIDGRYYCFRSETEGTDVSGSLINTAGTFTSEAGTYCINGNGQFLSGWQKLAGTWRFFDYDSNLEQTANSLAAERGANWYEVQSGSYQGIYYLVNGSSVAKGFKDISGKRYYFDSYGTMRTGDFAVGNVRYHAEDTEANGTVGEVYRNRWNSASNSAADSTCYYDGNGAMVTGWKKIDGSSYYFNMKGEKSTGVISLDNVRYFLDTSTGAMAAGRKVTVTVGDDDPTTVSYYADSNGKLLKGWQKLTIDGITGWHYYDTESCEEQTVSSLPARGDNWYEIADGSAKGTYYMTDGKSIAKGFKNIKDASGNTVQYYFDGNGILQTGDQTLSDESGFITAGNDKYRAVSDGGIVKWQGLVQEKNGGNVYYFDANGKMCTGWLAGNTLYADANGHVLTDWFSIENSRYYAPASSQLDEYGRIYKNCIRTIGSAIYMFGSSGRMLTGWQTMSGSRYYFDNDITGGTYGQAYANGVKVIEGKSYLFDADGKLLNSAGEYDVSGVTYRTDGNGVICSGWIRTGGNWNYYLADGTKADESKITVTAAADGKSKWRVYKENDEDDGKTYYFPSDSSLARGFASGVKGSISVTASDAALNKFYFDASTGAMVTGDFAVDGAYYHAGSDGVMYVNKWDDVGECYYDGSGKMLTGWQTISGLRYYFTSNGPKATGLYYVDNIRYLFTDTGMLCSPAGLYSYKQEGLNKWYCTNNNGAVQTGWVKISFNDGVTRWHYFEPSTGCMVNDDDITEITAYDGVSKWRVYEVDEDDVKTYYFYRDASLVTGWQTIKGTAAAPTDGTSHKFYFNPSTGELVTGEFAVGTSYYYAGTDGVVYTNKWRDADAGDEATERYYYNGNGARVSGWQSIWTDELGGSRKYYFDGDGILHSGVITVGNTRYLTASEDSSESPKAKMGMLLTGYYGGIDGKGIPADETTARYMTNGNGVIRTGWQKYDGRWHFMDHTTGIENRNPGTSYDNPGSTGWLNVKYYDGDPTESGVNSYTDYYYISNDAIVKGFRTIDNAKYYFDAETGVMRTGAFTVGSQTYYASEDGKIVSSGLCEDNGRFVYLDGSGTVKKGWISDSAGKYYADPDTGYVSVGFENIDGKVYYFDEGDTADTVGIMHTGFFTLPDHGQSYYDTTEDASNMYYAESDGAVVTSGWKTVSINPSLSTAQKWSYYMAPNLPGTADGDVTVTGEVVTGNAYIDGDGNVALEENLTASQLGLEDGAAVTQEALDTYKAANIDNYYRFDENTGARKKTVLYFYGDYHGIDADSGQISAMKSFAKFINTDRQFETESEDLIYVNSDSSADQQKLYNLGLTKFNPATTTYPKAASSYVSDEKSEYVANNDIAKKEGGVLTDCTDSDGNRTISGDGNVDMYDEQIYALDVYDRAIAKYGPNNLVMAGASSGAGTILSVLLCAARDGKAQPSETILFSPWVDMSMGGKITVPASGESREVYNTLKYWGARYTRDGSYIEEGKSVERYNSSTKSTDGWDYAFASPINYSMSYYSALKNVYVFTGSYDYCQNRAVDMVNKAKSAGAGIRLYNYSGQKHGYMFFAANSPAYETLRTAEYAVMTQQ